MSKVYNLTQIHADFILKHIKNAQILNNPFLSNSLFVVDSRHVAKNDIFVAIVGAQVDGHDFVGQALDAGASGFILNSAKKEELLERYGATLASKAIVFVPDSRQALIELAMAWRLQFFYPIVAVTGSVGKTTTKEMVRNILSLSGLKYVVSSGNQNTLIGVSLNILKLNHEHNFGVFEVGISTCGSMKEIAQLLKPTISLITNVGHGHMAGLGDVTSVAREKREIFAFFSPANIGVINGDQPELAAVSYNHLILRFGKKTTNQIQARKIKSENNVTSFILKIYNQKYAVSLPSCNLSRVNNALGAISIGYLLKISNEILIAGVQKPVDVAGRFRELKHASGSIIIDDCYNSNPDSAKSSLVAFNEYATSKKKIIVMGDMFELGIKSLFWHRQLGRMIHKVENVEHIILIGNNIQVAKKTLPIGIEVSMFATVNEAFELLKSMVLKKDNIFLCKASNSMKFSELIRKLQEV